jgi:hypothetical protein
MKKIMVLVPVLAIVSMFIAGCGKGGTEAANVNGTVITTQDLDDEIESLPPQYKMFAQSPDMKKKILDNLVISELLIQQAEKEGVLAKPDVQTKIREYENSIRTDAQSQIVNLKKQLEKASKIAKRETVIKELLQGKDFKDIQISDPELKQAYTQYSANMKRQDPNAKVEPFDKIKGDIRTSLARTKWLDSLKATAKITVNEAALASTSAAPSVPAMQQQSAPGAMKVPVKPASPAPAAAPVKK